MSESCIIRRHWAPEDEALLRAVANLAWDCTYEDHRHCTMWEER